MKKVISLILVTSLVLSISTSVFAFEKPLSTTENIIVKYNGHGEYVICDSLPLNMSTNIETMSVGDVTVATGTDDNDIYHIGNDKYLTRVYDDTYLLSEKIALDSDNFNNNISIFEKYNISDNFKEDIEKVIIAQKELGNDELIIDLYVPSTLSDGVQVMADEPLGTVYYDYYYNGAWYQLKDYSVKYTNLASGMIQKTGTNVLNYAKSFTNFIVSAAGITSKTVSAFSLFTSAYDLYKSYKGEVVTGSSSDLIYTNLIYARIVKDTYAADTVYGDFPRVSCTSHKVWLDRHDTYQFYNSTGQSYLAQESINKEFYSENFEDPAPMAIINGTRTSYSDSPLYTTIYGTTVRLLGE